MEQKIRDNIVPKDKWVFDEEVADCFEDMLQRSIPQYEIMRKATFELATSFLENKKKFSLLDIGCSDGLGLVDYIRRFGVHGHYLGIDCSDAMLNKAKERFSGYCEAGVCNFINMDLRQKFPTGTGAGEEHSGMILLSEHIDNTENLQNVAMNILYNENDYYKYNFRKLTPLGSWRLQGLSDLHYEQAKNAGLDVRRLYERAGRCVPVNVLESVFKSLFKKDNK